MPTPTLQMMRKERQTMIKSVEATGKTLEEAFANAMNELGIDDDTLNVEKVVLENPRSGFLGIGSSPAKVRVSYEVSRSDKALTFLQGLLDRMGALANPVVVKSNDENIELSIEGENLGMLIGRRGETLNAIQHITNYVVNRGEQERIRVIVDVENYRKKREESLRRLAELLMCSTLRVSSIRARLLFVGLTDKTVVIGPVTTNY
jgi:spoIIIJ-associated protein